MLAADNPVPGCGPVLDDLFARSIARNPRTAIRLCAHVYTLADGLGSCYRVARVRDGYIIRVIKC